MFLEKNKNSFNTESLTHPDPIISKKYNSRTPTRCSLVTVFYSGSRRNMLEVVSAPMRPTCRDTERRRCKRSQRETLGDVNQTQPAHKNPQSWNEENPSRIIKLSGAGLCAVLLGKSATSFASATQPPYHQISLPDSVYTKSQGVILIGKGINRTTHLLVDMSVFMQLCYLVVKVVTVLLSLSVHCWAAMFV